jgi:hypothetical protein
MAARVWPVDAVTGAPSYTGRALRQTSVSPFVAMGSTSRPLGGVSGVRPGTPASIVSATSTTWTVTPFPGVIDGEAAAIAGTYAYSFDTNQTGSVTAAAGSARIDRLDVQVSDPAESDGTSTPGIAIVYTAGTPGSGVAPAAPSRTHPLAQINVPASGGGSPTVTWTASYFAAPGGFVEFTTLTALNLWTPADPGQHATVIADPTTLNNGDYRWTGSAWVFSGYRSAPLTLATGWSGGTGVNLPRIEQNGSIVTIDGTAGWAGGGSYSNFFTVPSQFLPPTTSAARFTGMGAQITGTSLIAFMTTMSTSGVVGQTTGSSGSLPASGSVFFRGISWNMD